MSKIANSIGFNSFFITIVVVAYFYIIALSRAEGMKCVITLDSADQWVKMHEECSKSNKVDESKLEKLSLNGTIEDFEFDDNCFVQCIYKGNKILTSGGLVNKQETQKIFKGNMTEAMQKKVTSIWDRCVDDAERIAKGKGFNDCQLLTLHDFCFNKGMFEAEIHEMAC